MQNFYELVCGKSIAIVGNAITTKGSGLGKIIDSKDVIIRINNYAYPVLSAEAQDIGTKTDIMFFDRQQYQTYPVNGKYQGMPAFTINLDLQFEIARQYCGLSGTWGNFAPASGVSATFMCCMCSAKQIFLTGFDFFKTRGRYNGNYFPGRISGPCEKTAPHDFEKYKAWPAYCDYDLDEKIIRELQKHYPIEFDKALEKIIFNQEA